MTNIIFSGTNKELFDILTFDSAINAKWLTIDELVNNESDFENTAFVLFYSSPEAFLLSSGESAESNLDANEQQWQFTIELLMQFYLVNSKQSLLVDHERCISNTKSFFTFLENKLSFDKGACQLIESCTELALHEKLSRQITHLSIISNLKDNYSVQDSYENIVSAADLLIPDYDASIEQRQSESLNDCKQALKEVQELSLTNDKFAELTSENELSLLQIQQLQEELESNVIKNKGLTELVEVTKSELESATKQQSEELAEHIAENELSLLQIQQLQEELESIFLENKQLKEQEALQPIADNISDESKDNEIADLKVENELSLLQIHQLQEELEFYFIKYQSLSNNSFIKNKTAINIADKRFEKTLNLAKLLTA